jgi:hypothetical protein
MTATDEKAKVEKSNLIPKTKDCLRKQSPFNQNQICLRINRQR